jgi:hypothetical protein
MPADHAPTTTLPATTFPTTTSPPRLCLAPFHRLMAIAHDPWRLAPDETDLFDVAIAIAVKGLVDAVRAARVPDWPSTASAVVTTVSAAFPASAISNDYALALLARVLADLHHDSHFFGIVDALPATVHSHLLQTWAALCAASYRAGWYPALAGKPAQAAQALGSHVPSLVASVADALDAATTRRFWTKVGARLFGERYSPTAPRVCRPRRGTRLLPDRVLLSADVHVRPLEWAPTTAAFLADIAATIAPYGLPPDTAAAIRLAAYGIAAPHLAAAAGNPMASLAFAQITASPHDPDRLPQPALQPLDSPATPLQIDASSLPDTVEPPNAQVAKDRLLADASATAVIGGTSDSTPAALVLPEADASFKPQCSPFPDAPLEGQQSAEPVAPQSTQAGPAPTLPRPQEGQRTANVPVPPGTDEVLPSTPVPAGTESGQSQVANANPTADPNPSPVPGGSHPSNKPRTRLKI